MFGSVPFAVEQLGIIDLTDEGEVEPTGKGFVVMLATLAGAIAGIRKFVADLKGTVKVEQEGGNLQRLVQRIQLPLAPFLVIYGVLILANTVATLVSNRQIHPVSGTVVTAPLSDRTCERTVTFEMEARVFGVGHVIESFLETATREQYDKNAAFINEYLAAKR